MNRSIAGLSLCLMFCAASDAAAQGFNNPFVGTTLSSPSPKVYGAAGAGDLLLNVTSLKSVVTPNPQSLSSNYFAVNAGGGLMSAGLTLDRFDYWRANVGLVATF